jgi:hypothetical protein
MPASAGADPIAGAFALADQGRTGGRHNCDPHPGGVSDAPAELGLTTGAGQCLIWRTLVCVDGDSWVAAPQGGASKADDA